MTTNPMTCEQFEGRLADYMEGELRGEAREAFDAHAASCAQCGPLMLDLEQIVARAATLGPIEPSRDLWKGIEERIGTNVVPLATRRRTIPLWSGLIAASLLVAATAGITYKLARSGGPTSASPGNTSSQVAAATAEPTNPAPGGSGPIISAPPQVVANNDASGAQGETPRAGRTSRGGSPAAQLVGNRGRMPGESDVYDREISRLRTVLRSRRSDLDPRTVMAIEKSLAVIDTAIAQARSALAADPASRFLNDQLTHALDKKVELLRTAALLPARS